METRPALRRTLHYRAPRGMAAALAAGSGIKAQRRPHPPPAALSSQHPTMYARLYAGGLVYGTTHT